MNRPSLLLRINTLWLLSLILLLPLPVLGEEINDNLAAEPPVTHRLLEDGKRLAKRAASGQQLWQAAVKFCEAARQGSTEAQYQLAMLYSFGQGVPQSPALAAALFSQAAEQGHYESQKMLEMVPLSSAELPKCVLAEGNMPEKAKYRVFAYHFDSSDIETRINRLPANKRWLIDLVKTMSPWYKIDPRLALSIISVESNFEPSALSPKNAMGLMQIIPATAERFNVKDAFDVSQNIKAGLSYLRWLLTRYNGNIALTAAGYNAGEGAVDRYQGVPPYPETQQYVQRVLSLYRNANHSFQSKDKI